jgi:hypothetical protein
MSLALANYFGWMYLDEGRYLPVALANFQSQTCHERSPFSSVCVTADVSVEAVHDLK